MLKNNDYLTLITVYGPTMQRSQEEKEQFYEQLGNFLDDARNSKIIVLGDLNACVGLDRSSWPSFIGKHGVGNMISNGLMLLEFCSRFQLSVMGTMFQMRIVSKLLGNIPVRNIFTRLTIYLLTPVRNSIINVTKIDPTADCFTDHKLLITNCSCLIQPKKKGLKPPKKFDATTYERKPRLQSFSNKNF